MTHEPTLVIMAAGMGSRFGGLKQMTPVDEEGHFIIDFSLYDALLTDAPPIRMAATAGSVMLLGAV